MKIVVFTYDRYETLTTPIVLENAGVEFQVYCHTEDAKEKFIEAGMVKPERIMVSRAKKGLAHNRNVFLETLEKDEWCLMLCDDLMRIEEYQDYETSERAYVDQLVPKFWHKKFERSISMAQFLLRAKETAETADRYNIRLAGFAGVGNPLFRKKKWIFDRLCDGRALLVKKSDLRFDEKAQMVDDVAFSAENISRCNGTLVNNWILPEFRRYTKGAYGSITERMIQRRRECFYLTQKYRGLVKFAHKSGWPFGSHIRIYPKLKKS